ncbi:MAG: magnesium transporter CorA family protein [Patescibacteria group bacterium]|nr:magnesium transporter CorA family protein [Patescibacteria group bacterium]MDE1988596.1 magnesium transporter CorA family protein [Patescibacteria group bacterium]MDE2218343.1 magnesium transporter CorA family protein [Patescibacteria group bacterium]
MIKRRMHKQLAWIDIENPTSEEVRGIMEEFGLNLSVAQELLLPTIKPRVEMHRNFIYLILHFPALKHAHSEDINQEIDFVIGENFIITTRYDSIDPMNRFSKVFEVNSILDKSNIGEHAGYIFYYMIKEMYQSLGNELDSVKDSLKEIENEIFNGKEREMVVALSKVSRDLLNFRHATGAHKQVLRSFESAALGFFGESFSFYVKDILNEYYKIDNSVESNIESLRELRETNDSLLTTKQNEIMKTLTVMAFIILPLSFISSIYSMNTSFIPLAGIKNDFWIIMGLMVLVGLIIFMAFKWKKWL